MSAYDDAVAYLDAEVHPRCDYDIYRYMMDIVDEMEAENAKLRELVDAWMGCGTRYHTMQGACPMFDADEEYFCKAARLARKLGIEAGDDA